MMRFLWFAAFCCALCAVPTAQALDYTSPLELRVGASIGLMGTLPLGDDVAQPGAPDEFRKGLWVHVDAVSFDVGQYLQLSAFFRLVVAGGYGEAALRDAIDLDKIVSGPDRKMATVGASARVFPFGDHVVRPFLSLGLGYITAGGRFSTCPLTSGELGGLAGAASGATRKQAGGGGGCPITASQEGSFRHKGVGLGLGLGVRFDPSVQAFGEPWRLPIALEVSYQKNFWTGLDRYPEGIFDEEADTLSGTHPNLDFLGLLVTFGFLR